MAEREDAMDNELLIAAANNIEEYCEQMYCQECKVQRICDVLSDWFNDTLTLAERIKRST